MARQYPFELKAPWSEGTRVTFFSGEDLVGRLAATRARCADKGVEGPGATSEDASCA